MYRGEIEFRQDEPEFSSFFAKILPHLMIFQSGEHQGECCGTLKNHQIWKKVGKKLEKNEEKKPCLTCF